MSGILKTGPGEAHLQNEIISYKCLYCQRESGGDDIVLIRMNDKEMAFACLSHPGALQMFVEQYGRPPLGYEKETPLERSLKKKE